MLSQAQVHYHDRFAEHLWGELIAFRDMNRVAAEDAAVDPDVRQTLGRYADITHTFMQAAEADPDLYHALVAFLMLRRDSAPDPHTH